MANGKVLAVVLALVIAVFIGISSMFQVAAWEKAVLFRLGEIVRTDIQIGRASCRERV